MDSTKTLRFSTYCLWGGIFCLPLLTFWASQAKFGTVMVQAWLPGDDASRTKYSNFLEHFGDDQLLFVTWTNCSLDDPRLDRLTDDLSKLQRSDPSLGILQIQNSRQIIARLTEGPAAISIEAALDRLSGIAIGSDGSCFIALRLAEANNADRTRMFDEIQKQAARSIDVRPPELILGGEPFHVYVIDQASRDTIRYFVPPSSILALLLAWLCLGGLRTTLLVFLIAGVGQLIGLALIAIFLGQMSSVMVVLPTLVFMLTLSAAIHLTNYYRESGGEANPLAGVEAVRLGVRPCLLATLTTVFGFGSLWMSDLEPVWHFGGLAALGLIVTTVALLGVFPALISLGIWRGKLPHYPSTAPPTRWLPQRLTQLTGTHASLITLFGLGGLLLSGLGITRLQTSTKFEDMFPATSPAVQSLNWIQQHLGPIHSFEFVISFPKPTPEEGGSDRFESGVLERLQAVGRVQDALQQLPETVSVMSALTFLPTIPDGRGTRNTIRRAVLRRLLSGQLGTLQSQHLLSDAADSQLWRLSARMREPIQENFETFLARLQQQVEQSLSPDASFASQSNRAELGERSALAGNPKVCVTGLRTVMAKAHFSLLSDLGYSFLTAFLLIAPVMMLIVRSPLGGLLLMIPNVLPVVLVFGSMGWLQIKLDVASILTASVALGIAVDDTLHFVTWFTRARREGGTAQAAVELAIANCARPMLHTTIICAGSMLPFFFSEFLPTSKFALLLILILGGAILGDLILLPALLQSRLGSWIGQHAGVPRSINGPSAS
jgi:predicted RND superfamily exporter protein